MKRSYKNHIPYTIAAFATILAIAFYFKSNTLNNELNKIKSKSISKSDSIAYATHLKTYNTLLDKGNYKGALDIILENENTISVHSKIESELLKELILFKTKYKNIQNDLDSLKIIDSTMSKRLATPNEVRQYDSLIFALKKTNIQLENIKKQYTKKSFGQYLTFKSGKGTSIHYVGEVKNGKANGNGMALLSSGSRYEGNWKDNLWHGKGSFFWPDGDKYVGDYKENKRTGKGTYYWHNGDKYVGEWKNDKRDGEGTFYNNDGKIVIGIWSLDELVEKK